MAMESYKSPAEGFTEEAAARLNVVIKGLENQARDAPGGDEAIRAFCRAALRMSAESESFAEDLRLFAMVRDDISRMPFSEAAGIVRACVFADIMKYHDDEFPLHFDNPDIYLRWMENMLSDYDRRGIFIQGLCSNKILTNHPQREVPPELFLQAMYGCGLMEKGISVLDIGTGLALGPKHAMLKHRYPFESPLVLGPMAYPGEERPGLPTSQELTAKSAELLARPPVAGLYVGVDVMDAYDPEIKRRARASLRVKEELCNPDFMEVLDALDEESEEDANVDFFQADFSDPGDVAHFKERYPGKKFDLIRMITVGHQLSPQQYDAVHENLAPLLAEGGFVFEQDFGYLPPKQHNPTHMRPYQEWYTRPWRYKSFLRSEVPLGGLREIARSRDGRCREIKILGQVMLGGIGMPFYELIMEA